MLPLMQGFILYYLWGAAVLVVTGVYWYLYIRGLVRLHPGLFERR